MTLELSTNYKTLTNSKYESDDDDRHENNETSSLPSLCHRGGMGNGKEQ